MVNYIIVIEVRFTMSAKRVLRRYIGDKKFYGAVLAVALPMIVQNGITNLVNLLDNVMVGRLSTEAMSGVSIVNQFIFIFNLLIFGAVSAAGIFTAQFHGSRDVKGEMYTLRFKLMLNLVASVACVAIFAAFDDELITWFLLMEESAGELDPALALLRGKEYLRIMLIGLVPCAISQAYASTMRETEQTVVPMWASAAAVATNFVLNAILIFGLFGAPALGVRGAAIATVISRFVELGILLIWGYSHKAECPYLCGCLRSLYLPHELFGQILSKGIPLMVNELLWAVAMTARNQSYSTRGLEVVAAHNISISIINLFSVVYLSLGSAIAIVVGNQLGAGEVDKARDTQRKMVAFSVTCAAGVGLILIALVAPVFPLLYEAPDVVRSLASFMIVVTGCAMPFFAYAHAAYFTLRSGGRVAITFLFDSVYMWVIVIPIVFVLSRYTDISIYWLFIAGNATEILKCVFGFIFLRKINWARRLVSSDKPEQ